MGCPGVSFALFIGRRTSNEDDDASDASDAGSAAAAGADDVDDVDDDDDRCRAAPVTGGTDGPDQRYKNMPRSVQFNIQPWKLVKFCFE